jgi:hypothetical protein
MNATHDIRTEVLSGLVELLDRRPQLRPGQLLCNLANFALGDTAAVVWTITDDELLTAIQEHRHQLGDRDLRQPAEYDPAVRADFFQTLEKLAATCPEIPIGLLCTHLAFTARGVSAGMIWEVEDHELLQAARQQLELNRRRMRLENEARAALAAHPLWPAEPVLEPVANRP